MDRFERLSAETQARNILIRLGYEDAKSRTSGDLAELANLIAEVHRLRRRVTDLEWETNPDRMGR